MAESMVGEVEKATASDNEIGIGGCDSPRYSWPLLMIVCGRGSSARQPWAAVAGDGGLGRRRLGAPAKGRQLLERWLGAAAPGDAWRTATGREGDLDGRNGSPVTRQRGEDKRGKGRGKIVKSGKKKWCRQIM